MIQQMHFQAQNTATAGCVLSTLFNFLQMIQLEFKTNIGKTFDDAASYEKYNNDLCSNRPDELEDKWGSLKAGLHLSGVS